MRQAHAWVRRRLFLGMRSVSSREQRRERSARCATLRPSAGVHTCVPLPPRSGHSCLSASHSASAAARRCTSACASRAASVYSHVCSVRSEALACTAGRNTSRTKASDRSWPASLSVRRCVLAGSASNSWPRPSSPMRERDNQLRQRARVRRNQRAERRARVLPTRFVRQVHRDDQRAQARVPHQRAQQRRRSSRLMPKHRMHQRHGDHGAACAQRVAQSMRRRDVQQDMVSADNLQLRQRAAANQAHQRGRRVRR
jgi:hypothetical protein